MGTKRGRTEPLPAGLGQHSDLSFGQALDALRQARGLSFRQLEAATREVDSAGKGLSIGWLNQISSGKRQIAKEDTFLTTVHLLAETLKVDPQYFREYREHLAAEQAKKAMSAAGFDEVMEALAQLKKTRRSRKTNGSV